MLWVLLAASAQAGSNPGPRELPAPSGALAAAVPAISGNSSNSSNSSEGGPLLLRDKVRPADLAAALAYRLDATGQMTVEQIDRLPDEAFAPVGAGPLELGDGALWQRFDALTSPSPARWYLALPLPGMGEATLHYRDSGGQWQRQEAGQRRAMSHWVLPGRYPVFALRGEAGGSTRYYLELRQAHVPYWSVPVVLTDAELLALRQDEHLLLGIYFGLAMLVIVLASAQAVAYRDIGFASFALYAAMQASAQGAVTGVAALYLWPEWPAINQAASIVFGSLAAAASLLFVYAVALPYRRSPLLGRLMLGLAALVVVSGAVNAGWRNAGAFAVYNLLLVATVAMVAVAVFHVLRDAGARLFWLGWGFLPLAVAVYFPLMRNFGIIETGLWTQHATMLGFVVGAPVLFYGLFKSLNRHHVSARRARLLQVIDPLTGLLSARAMAGKVRRALAALQRQQQPFALLVVNFVNHGVLQSAHGREVGDRALLMAAARIRAVARLSDTVARAGDAQFALLMTGAVTAELANELATKILASGLRMSAELPEAQSLQFHIALCHLTPQDMVVVPDADTCLTKMLRAVHEMQDGSRKAIRRVVL